VKHIDVIQHFDRERVASGKIQFFYRHPEATFSNTLHAVRPLHAQVSKHCRHTHRRFIDTHATKNKNESQHTFVASTCPKCAPANAVA
jgi:hypothetical protein